MDSAPSDVRMHAADEIKTADVPVSTLEEGSASILVKEGEVFYNKVQTFNRDLSIVAIKTFCSQRKKEFAASVALAEAKAAKKAAATAVAVAQQKHIEPLQGVKILEALSATGLRSIRYWKEIPEEAGDVASILVNDLDPAAVETIRKNIVHNQLPLDKLIPNQGDANLVMYGHLSKSDHFDVVDLDPYGTASPFLDAAVQSVSEGGARFSLLAITCTDSAVLCGNHSEAGWAKYGCMPLRGPYCHEMAVRIVLAATMQAANRHRRYIVPMLSLSIDFYVRMFVRVYESPTIVKHSASKMAYVYQCVACESFALQPVGKIFRRENSVKFAPANGPVVDRHCAHCGKNQRMGGPIWAEPIHDAEFVQHALQYVEANQSKFATSSRMLSMLTLASEELPACPLYYTLPALCRVPNLPVFKNWYMRAALLNGGYKVSMTHCADNGFKTDAPASVIWDIIRAYARKENQPVKPLPPDSAGAAILAKEPEFKADFTKCEGADVSAQARKHSGQGALFPGNPEENWGPKTRAVSGKRKTDGDVEAKRKANQNKRSRRTKPCFTFQETGQCPRGDACRFSHNVPVTGAPNPSIVQTNSPAEIPVDIAEAKTTPSGAAGISGMDLDSA